MFVLPSVISAFACVLPVMWAIFSKLQGTKVEWSAQIIPDVGALLEGLFVGLFIPALSAIIPI